MIFDFLIRINIKVDDATFIHILLCDFSIYFRKIIDLEILDKQWFFGTI